MMLYSALSSEILNGEGCRWKAPKCLRTLFKVTNICEENECDHESDDQSGVAALDTNDSNISARVSKTYKTLQKTRERNLRDWKKIMGRMDKVIFVVCLFSLTLGFLGITITSGE